MDEPFVVFLIGMRVNRPLAFGKWIATARAMGPMVRELQQHPQKGLLGVEQFFYWPGAALVQYWRSFEDLERFARNPDDSHFPAWHRFNQTIGTDGSRATTRRSTTTCRSSAWPRRPSMCQPRVVWRLPGAA